MKHSFVYHTDPGHGWLEVTLGDCLDVGLNCLDISRYSYVRGNTLYLEEDCDAPKFIKAYEAKHGFRPSFEDHYQERTRIRTYAHHNPGEA